MTEYCIAPGEISPCFACASNTLYLGIGNCNMLAMNSMTDEEFELHTFAILQRELGLDGLARFLRLNRAGVGDYTRDRHRWLSGVTIQDIMAEVGSRSRPTT